MRKAKHQIFANSLGLLQIRCVYPLVTMKYYPNMPPQWLLHLLTEDDPEVVVHGTKILARLLIIHGSGYVSKFAGKTGGFAIMRHRLKRWWDLPTLWPICFSILFARDVADIDFERPFELFSLLETFSNCKVVYPNVLPVITSMLQSGLNVRPVITHRLGVNDYREGFEIMNSGQSGKVILDWSSL